MPSEYSQMYRLSGNGTNDMERGQCFTFLSLIRKACVCVHVCIMSCINLLLCACSHLCVCLCGWWKLCQRSPLVMKDRHEAEPAALWKIQTHELLYNPQPPPPSAAINRLAGSVATRSRQPREFKEKETDRMSEKRIKGLTSNDHLQQSFVFPKLNLRRVLFWQLWTAGSAETQWNRGFTAKDSTFVHAAVRLKSLIVGLKIHEVIQIYQISFFLLFTQDHTCTCYVGVHRDNFL